MKRCSTSLALREMQIKTVMRYILMRMANDKTSKQKAKQEKEKKYWQYQVLVRMQNNWDFHSLLVGMQNGTGIQEEHLAVSYKPIPLMLPRNPTPGGDFSLENENLRYTKTWLSVFIAVLFTTVKNNSNWKQLKCPLHQVNG